MDYDEILNEKIKQFTKEYCKNNKKSSVKYEFISIDTNNINRKNLLKTQSLINIHISNNKHKINNRAKSEINFNKCIQMKSNGTIIKRKNIKIKYASNQKRLKSGNILYSFK